MVLLLLDFGYYCSGLTNPQFSGKERGGNRISRALGRYGKTHDDPDTNVYDMFVHLCAALVV